MRRMMMALGIFGALSIGASRAVLSDDGIQDAQNVEFHSPTGKSASFSLTGSINLAGTFFQSLGNNGRSCATCHLSGDGWSLSAKSAQALFGQTGGTHPLFEFDGQNCPGADRSTVNARRSASSLMLNRGLVRFIAPVSFTPSPEFELIAWEGTYCNPMSNAVVVLYRRSLPLTNFATLSTVGWHGIGDLISPVIDEQLIGATVIATQQHAETNLVMSPGQLGEVFTFMRSMSTAVTWDEDAKDVTAKDALGGPENLASLPLNGPPGFTLYDTWSNVPGGGTNVARRTVARGQAIFNDRCAGCHNSPNRGNSTSGAYFNLGLSDASRRPADLPLYTVRRLSNGETRQLSDLGRANITGKWADLGKFKVPGLRGVSTHAPYFHNGLAATLADVVEFYNGRFNMQLSSQDKADLVSFLRAL